MNKINKIGNIRFIIYCGDPHFNNKYVFKDYIIAKKAWGLIKSYESNTHHPNYFAVVIDTFGTETDLNEMELFEKYEEWK